MHLMSTELWNLLIIIAFFYHAWRKAMHEREIKDNKQFIASKTQALLFCIVRHNFFTSWGNSKFISMVYLLARARKWSIHYRTDRESVPMYLTLFDVSPIASFESTMEPRLHKSYDLSQKYLKRPDWPVSILVTNERLPCASFSAYHLDHLLQNYIPSF